VSSLAREQLAAGYELRGEGSGLGRMVRARDLGAPPVRLSPIRERIARRLRESLAHSAQYTLNASANAAALLGLRARIKAARETRELPDINVSELVMFAAVRALVEMPELNAELIDGQLYQPPEIHLGFACDTPRGLLVPVVRNCQKLSLAELSLEVKRLAQAAADGTISPDELSGGTFTVSNLGSLGIESFTPILNPPQVALLGVNAIELKPVRGEGGVVFVEHIGLSLTCDHQVIDGAAGARFLRLLAEKIERIDALCGLDL
jgi:pyruvate dehydrogenase E2 component (dihydrolipoamide acetyltransferase)